jgi:hypothetical protein
LKDQQGSSVLSFKHQVRTDTTRTLKKMSSWRKSQQNYKQKVKKRKKKVKIFQNYLVHHLIVQMIGQMIILTRNLLNFMKIVMVVRKRMKLLMEMRMIPQSLTPPLYIQNLLHKFNNKRF